MTHVLGVDGGASKTLAVLLDERGEVLGAGRAGTGNFEGIGLDESMVEIRDAARAALAMAGMRSQEVALACYCLAGADFPEDFELLRPALAKLKLARRMTLHNDTMAALWSGTNGPDAVTVIVGSGTNGAGCNAEGDEFRLPAVGWISGDWGGGGDLSQDAVWHVARAWDGRGEPTALSALIFDALDVPDGEQMIRKFYFQQVDRDAYRSLAPLVFRAAEMGDCVARGLIERQGKEVAITAGALLRRLELLDRPADVVLVGSIFKGEGDLLMDTVRAELTLRAPLARIVHPDVEPAVGAAFCGLRELGLSVDDEVRACARTSYERLEKRAAEVKEW